VEDHAEEEREGADGIEGVQTVVGRHRALLLIRRNPDGVK
jgi:hypothetical protein